MRFAMLMFALAACGDDSVHHLADAPPGDSSVDASGQRQVVQVSISQGGVARAGIHVVVTDPDGGYGGTVDTDATGLATAMAFPGGAVTALDPFVETGTNLYTVTDVQAGDLIELATYASTPSVDVSVTLATYTGAAGYYVSPPCGGGPAAGLKLVGCPATTPLIVTAQDATSNALATIYEAHAPVAASLDVSAVPWVPVQNTTYTFANTLDNPFGTVNIVANEGLVYTYSDIASGGALTMHLPAQFGTAKRIVDAGTSVVHNFDQTTHHVLNPTTSVDFASRLADLTQPNTDGAHVYWTPIGGAVEPDVAIGTIRRTSDGVTRHFIAPLLGTLDSTMAGVVLPTVNGVDVSGTWDVDELATVKAGGGEKAMRQKGLAGDYQYAMDGTLSLEADYLGQVE